MRVAISGVLFFTLLSCGGGGDGSVPAPTDTSFDWGWVAVDTIAPGSDLTSGTDIPLTPGDDTTVSYPLVPGDPVPEFSLPAHSDATISLVDYSGKIMVLSFFPTASQGLSQQQIEKLEARYGEIRALGAFPFGVSMEDTTTLAHWADDLALKSLLLLTDEGGHIGDMFGLEHGEDHYLHRGDIVIAADGTLKSTLLYDAKEPADIQALITILEAE